MSIVNPTEDQLNEWLSQQTMRGTIGGNRLAELAINPYQLQAMQQDNAMGGDAGVQYATQPMNTIRSSSGRVIDLNYAAKGGSGIAPDGRRVSHDVQADGPRVLSRYRLPDGTFEVIKEVPVLDGFGRQSSRMIREIETPDYLNPAALKNLDYQTKLANLQKIQAEARGGAKPQFVDGQWVYPPSQDAPMGRAVKVEGFSKAEKPPTDEQSKAGGFGVRAATSHEILNYVGNDGKVQPGKIKRSLEAVPFAGESLGTLTNWTQSAGQQQIEQAQRDFVNAILRRESGAVINPSEFENAAKQYFPQPGDSPAVIQQKKMNRENAIASLETSAGPVAPKVKSARQKMQTIFEAHKAIKGGADREAVRARLEEMGINDHGL